uniref:Uncharacterized protein n=1 Tax=Siphoviridae sp. ct9lR64 TaxID=2826178 RepID=A0A8S5QY72_9CAUD|nr:MAG TPA: hypothetical protein [Siphoviridae sp. ct9lR64]
MTTANIGTHKYSNIIFFSFYLCFVLIKRIVYFANLIKYQFPN